MHKRNYRLRRRVRVMYKRRRSRARHFAEAVRTNLRSLCGAMPAGVGRRLPTEGLVWRPPYTLRALAPARK